MNLTQKQKEVVELMLLGKRDKEIARELGIPRRTIGHRIEAAQDLLGAETRVHLAVIYLKETHEKLA